MWLSAHPRPGVAAYAGKLRSDYRNVQLFLCIFRRRGIRGLLRLRSRALHLIRLLPQFVDVNVAALHLFHQLSNLLLLSFDCLLHF